MLISSKPIFDIWLDLFYNMRITQFSVKLSGFPYDDKWQPSGRLKIKPFGPVFVAGGYRYDSAKIDYQDIDIDAEFEGPFAEVGLDF